jgi:hypothetical protein
MKKLALALFAAGVSLAVASPAAARTRCGRGWHSGWHNHCVRNWNAHRSHVVLRVGTYYHGHGWWDGHRYWQHRERWHGHWRYR